MISGTKSRWNETLLRKTHILWRFAFVFLLFSPSEMNLPVIYNLPGFISLTRLQPPSLGGPVRSLNLSLVAVLSNQPALSFQGHLVKQRFSSCDHLLSLVIKKIIAGRGLSWVNGTHLGWLAECIHQLARTISSDYPPPCRLISNV